MTNNQQDKTELIKQKEAEHNLKKQRASLKLNRSPSDSSKKLAKIKVAKGQRQAKKKKLNTCSKELPES